MSESSTHYSAEFKHAADMEWEMGGLAMSPVSSAA